MKIIELKNNHKGHWRHTCSECGTVFDFDKSDTKGHWGEDDEDYYHKVDCPNSDCRATIYEEDWTDLTYAK